MDHEAHDSWQFFEKLKTLRTHTQCSTGIPQSYQSISEMITTNANHQNTFYQIAKIVDHLATWLLPSQQIISIQPTNITFLVQSINLPL